MMRGNRIFFGNYVECMSFPVDPKNNVSGQYCLLTADFDYVRDYPTVKHGIYEKK